MRFVLNKIIQKTDAEIVLSSSWRTFLNLEQLDDLFFENNVVKSTVDITPIELFDQGIEIEQFIANNFVNKYVVLDDMDIQGHDKNFIKINSETGLTEDILSKIINKLK